MSLRNTQKPLGSLLSVRETAAIIVAVPAGTQPTSVMTAAYDVEGFSAPLVSNKMSHIGMLSPVDGANLTQSTETVNPEDIEYITKDHLIKIGECACCASDVYADTVTAEAMQDDKHSGACLMCGAGVSFANSGQKGDFITHAENTKPAEVANYFDFDELNTVDPVTLEENDMSNRQARRALLANVATALQTIVNKDEQPPAVLASDEEEDFASESDEDSEELDVMDMDESEDTESEDDESEDDSDEDETSDEEASDDNVAAAPSEEDNTEGAQMSTPADNIVETPAPEAAPVVTTEETPAVAEVAEEVPAVTEETPAAEVAEETTEAAPEVTTEEAPVESAPTDSVVVAEANDEATIEYVATTPAEISPDAELIPVSETAIYVVQDNAPVAVLRKEQASAGAQALWHKPTEIRNAFRAAFSGDREVALAQLGGSILRHSTKVAAVVAQRVTDQETAAANEIAAERAQYQSNFKQSLEIAGLGIAKGLFGKAFHNPVAAELAQVLSLNGVREPNAVITASMVLSMPKLTELLLTKAAELAELSEDVRNAQAEMVGNAEFIAPVATTPAEAAKPSTAEPETKTETAAAPAKKLDVSVLTRSLGRNIHHIRPAVG